MRSAMSRRVVATAAVLVLLVAALPANVLGASGPSSRIDEVHQRNRAGVVYSIHADGNIDFSDASEVCVNLDYHEPWHDASWSLVMWDGVRFQSATFFILDAIGDSTEAFVVVDTRGIGGPRQEVSVIDIPPFRGGTGLWCLGLDRIADLTFDDEMHVVVGAPDAEWTRVEVDLRASSTMNWNVQPLARDAGLWTTDRGMRHQPGTPGVNVRAGPAQASVLWGIDETVPSGNRTFTLAGPMPRTAAAGTWSIDGPGPWDTSWTGVGAPTVAVNGQPIGLIGLFDAPAGTYAYRYDGATSGFVGFFAHLLPYDTPSTPAAP